MHPMPTGITVLHHDGDGPPPVARVLQSSDPEPDPEREGWRVLLALAQTLLPRGSVDELVELAASLAPAECAGVDRRLVQDVALTMTLTTADGA